jgi:hypothetical protein
MSPIQPSRTPDLMIRTPIKRKIHDLTEEESPDSAPEEMKSVEEGHKRATLVDQITIAEETEGRANLHTGIPLSSTEGEERVTISIF